MEIIFGGRPIFLAKGVKHLACLQEMAEELKTNIAGSMSSDSEICAIVVCYAVTTKEARRLAEADPAVEAGPLGVEVHPRSAD